MRDYELRGKNEWRIAVRAPLDRYFAKPVLVFSYSGNHDLWEAVA